MFPESDYYVITINKMYVNYISKVAHGCVVWCQRLEGATKYTLAEARKVAADIRTTHDKLVRIWHIRVNEVK